MDVKIRSNSLHIHQVSSLTVLHPKTYYQTFGVWGIKNIMLWIKQELSRKFQVYPSVAQQRQEWENRSEKSKVTNNLKSHRKAPNGRNGNGIKQPLNSDGNYDHSSPSKAVQQLASLVSQRMKGDHLEDLHELMSLEQRYLFLDKLFHDHEKYFEAFLNGLNNIATWKEASAILDKLYMQQEVDPYSHVALEFSDLVYNRYFPKDKAHYTGVKFKA